MVRTTCCVPGCSKRGGYQFPSNAALKRAWLEAIQRPNWVPKPITPVCRDHFRDQDFRVEAGGATTDVLRWDAVPSVFWWSGTSYKPPQQKVPDGVGGCRRRWWGPNNTRVTPMAKDSGATGKGAQATDGKKTVHVMGSALCRTGFVPSVGKLEDTTDVEEYDFTNTEEDERYSDEDDNDDYTDAGAIPDDTDDEYRGEEDDDEEDLEEEDLLPAVQETPRSRPISNKGRGQLDDVILSGARPRSAPSVNKNKGRKRKMADADIGSEDDILKHRDSEPPTPSPEYSRQVNKAYKEVSRLSTRCQMLEAALKNKTMVTHRSRTIYQIGKYVLPHQLSFIESQMVNSTVAPAQRRWSRRMRNICLGLLRHSRHAYSFMAKIFAMPTEAELERWGAEPEGEGGEAPANNVSLEEAQALLDEVTFDNLMSVLL